PGINREPRKVIWAASGKPVVAYETVVGGQGAEEDGQDDQESHSRGWHVHYIPVISGHRQHP
ncbi:hypothetical protein, partial [Streptomyces sp. NPDC003877]